MNRLGGTIENLKALFHPPRAAMGGSKTSVSKFSERAESPKQVVTRLTPPGRSYRSSDLPAIATQRGGMLSSQPGMSFRRANESSGGAAARSHARKPNGIYFVSGKALAAGDSGENAPQPIPTASALSLTTATFGGKVVSIELTLGG